MKWVKYSTDESIKNKQISTLAIFEVFISVFIYWGIAIYYDFYWHIIASVSIAPFLLLQSRVSVRTTLHLFSVIYTKLDQNIFVYILFKVFITTMFLACAYFESYYLFFILIPIIPGIIFTFFKLVFTNLVINKGIKGRMPLFFDFSVARPTLGYLILIPLVIYYLLFLYIMIFALALLTKIFVTLKFFRYGFNNVINNWTYQNFLIDLMKIPEILPGIEKHRGLDQLKFSQKIIDINEEENMLISLIILVSYILNYTMGFFYRFSIKSTFWFYLPLLFLVKSPNNLDSPSKRGLFLSLLYETKAAGIRLFAAIIILLSFLITYFSFLEVDSFSSPYATLIMVIYFDFTDVQLWKLLQITVAILTIFLYLYSDLVRTPYVSNKIKIKKDAKVMSIYYINRIRNLISFCYFSLAFIYILYFFKIWESPYVPKVVQQWLEYLVEIVTYKLF